MIRRLWGKLTYPYRYAQLRRAYPKAVAQRKAKAGRGRPRRLTRTRP